MESSKKRQIKIKKIIQKQYKAAQQTLILNWCQEMWIDIISAQDWSILRYLILYHCQVDDYGLGMLVNKQWPELISLNLYENKITLEGVKSLLSKKWQKLQQLNQSKNQIGDNGFLLILQNLNLRQLLFEKCGITSYSWQKILYPQLNLAYNYQNLQLLYLENNKLGSIGIKLLIKIFFPKLTELIINQTKIGEQGCRNLIKSIWPNLSVLILNNNLTNLNKSQICNQYPWKKLKKIRGQQQLIGLLAYVLVPVYSNQDIPKIDRYKLFTTDNQSLQSSVEQLFRDRDIYDTS